MSATSVLDGAAALLRQGWVRGAYVREVDGVRCYCLAGALIAAGIGLDDAVRLRAERGVRDELDSRAEPRSFSIYNDRRAESVDDVLAVLEAAKARLS